MRNKLIVIMATLLTPFLVHAECEKYFESWSAQLHEKGSVDLAYATCRVWPANTALTLATLPIPHKENSGDMGTYDLAILVADSLTGNVIASLNQPSAINYDAIRLTSITIDTARYQLTSSNRAFGVRVVYSGSSKIFPFSTTAMTLFLMDDKVLRPVLNNFIVEDSSGDWDGTCAGSFKRTSRSLDIGGIGAEGYATLKISESISTRVNKLSGAECVTREQPAIRSNTRLDYHAKHYRAPKRMTLNF
jgi:hypothetical protein